MAEYFVSYSSLIMHRACPQRWKYSYSDLLTKAQKDSGEVARDLGTWWHMIRAADSIVRGEFLGTLKWKPEHLSGPDGRKISTIDITVEKVYGLIAD